MHDLILKLNLIGLIQWMPVILYYMVDIACSEWITMGRKRSIKGLESIAYHEAGHAVASFYMYIKFRHVTIVPDEDYNGCVRCFSPKFMTYFEGWNAERQRNFLDKQIIVSLAGYLAQKKFSPHSIRKLSNGF